MDLDEWIDCNERLPTDGGEYIVYEILNNKVQHDYWNNWCDVDHEKITPFWNHYGKYVTHWIPLPNPPKMNQ